MASLWWPFGRGGSSSAPANFLHLSRTNIQRICDLTSHEERLNPNQCRSISSKLERTMQSIEGLAYSSDNFSLVCDSTALENFYRVSEKAKQLVENCCSVNWIQASAFHIQNEEAFKEILLETSLCYNTIYEFAKDISQNRELVYDDLRQSSTFEPPSADEVFKDQVVLLDRLNDLVNVPDVSSSHTRSQYLGKYLLRRMNYVLSQSNHEDFDVRTLSLWPDGRGPDGEWSKELEPLGGNVYTTTWLDVPCAKKLFKDEMQEDEWLAEARILATLNHPNIVKFLCCNKYESAHSRGHFIAMEKMETSLCSYIKGLRGGGGSFILFGSHSRRLEEGGAPFSLLPALDIILQIAYGMCYLHENGIAHRDLKTSNVVVRNLNAPHLQYHLHVKLVDFGLSKMKLRASKSNTISCPKRGTTLYMSPEAFSNGRANWFKADVYSFSVMCSVILTGDEPFQNIKRIDLYGAICRGERPKLPANIPQELTSLIMEGWATDRDLRPSFIDICTRLEKLRHRLLRDHTLDSSKQKEHSNYSNLYIEEMLKRRSEAREQDCSHVHLQIVEEEWFDGDELDRSQQHLANLLPQQEAGHLQFQQRLLNLTPQQAAVLLQQQEHQYLLFQQTILSLQQVVERTSQEAQQEAERLRQKAEQDEEHFQRQLAQLQQQQEQQQLHQQRLQSADDQKKKVTRRRIRPPPQLEVLERVFAAERYPAQAVLAELSSRLYLSDKQLQMWFCHRRLKDREGK